MTRIVQVGEHAPDFALAPGPGPDRVTLSEQRGAPVVLLFVPLAFSGACTDELCHVGEDWSIWSQLGVRVLGLSVDSPFVVQRWRADMDLPFPLLSDCNRDAASAFGVLYDDFFGMKDVAKRSVFVVDRAGVVAYAWVTEDADVQPPFDEVLEVVRSLT